MPQPHEDQLSPFERSLAHPGRVRNQADDEEESKETENAEDEDEEMMEDDEDEENSKEESNSLSYKKIKGLQKLVAQADKAGVDTKILDLKLIEKSIEFRRDNPNRKEWDSKAKEEYKSLTSNIKAMTNEIENAMLFGNQKDQLKGRDPDRETMRAFTKRNGSQLFLSLPTTQDNKIDFNKLKQSAEGSYTDNIVSKLSKVHDFEFISDLMETPSRAVLAIPPEVENQVLAEMYKNSPGIKRFAQSATSTAGGRTAIGDDIHSEEYRSDLFQEIYWPQRILDSIGVRTVPAKINQKITRALTSHSASKLIEGAAATTGEYDI